MVPDYAEPLLKLWPGGITLVFRAGDGVPAALTGGTGKIGVRMPAHPVAKALVEASAAHHRDQRQPVRLSSILCVTDPCPGNPWAGGYGVECRALAGGAGSTILDVTCWPVEVIREGAVPRRAIDEVLRNG
jgi:L-threonylcarbamoyladenylate synthase